MPDDYLNYLPRTNRIHIRTTEGIISFSVSFAKLIYNGKYNKRKPGTCGSCGEKSQIYRFERDHERINLCSECLSKYQIEFERLFEKYREDIVTHNI